MFYAKKKCAKIIIDFNNAFSYHYDLTSENFLGVIVLPSYYLVELTAVFIWYRNPVFK